MLEDARRRAKSRGLPCTITVADIVVPSFCPVLGIPLVPSETGKPWSQSPTLDRIDNTRGYVPGNVIVISHKANSIKRNATPEELERVARFFRQFVQ